MKQMLGLMFLCLSVVPIFADMDTDKFLITDVRVETMIDIYGVEEQVVVGNILNDNTQAYADVSLFAEALNADDEVIGEAFGFIVNECGVALLDDPLKPQESAVFSLKLDLYSEFSGDDAIPVKFDVMPSGTLQDTETTSIEAIDGITQISNAEVVSAQWLDDNTLLYGTGCDERIFIDYVWSTYDLTSQESTSLDAHPSAGLVTEDFINASGVTRSAMNAQEQDPALLQRSYLTPIPNSTRFVWQDDIHELYTAGEDGRLGINEVHTYLHQYSLKGFVFTPDANFLAYYFGAYGEPVRYITARADGQLISDVITVNPVSNTVPGLWNDGFRAIISGVFDEGAGYYLQATNTPENELLFNIPEEELTGNNYPAPVYYRVDRATRYMYIIRPIDGVATLQCHFYEGKSTNTLTSLPLQLQSDERSWAWISPNGQTLAISANGRNSGLWLVDLTALPTCGTTDS
jgi:hypothetical protein